MDKETKLKQCLNCGIENDIKLYNSKSFCETCYLKDKEKEFVLEKKQIIFSDMDQINDKIYIGNSNSAKDRVLLASAGITHVLMIGAYLYEFFPNDFKYKSIVLEDDESEDISSHFLEAFEFIDSSDFILIHCFAGVSRSPAFAIAYLMLKNKKPYNKVYTYVKNKRKHISPNNGFKNLLIGFDKFLIKNEYVLPEGVVLNKEVLEKYNM